MSEVTIPAGREGWEAWCQQHLSFLKTLLKDDHAFDELCNRLKADLDILKGHYEEDENQPREKTDRQKEPEQKLLMSLQKKLVATRKEGLFKGQAPDLFMSLLIQCCETEYCKAYKKGTHDAKANRYRAEFIAKTANLIYEFTGNPFQYNSKVDPLCIVVCKCLDGIDRKVSDSAVRDAIREYIKIIASPPTGEFAATSTDFDYKYLKSKDATTDNLPRGYVYRKAVPRYKSRETTTTNKTGFRHSFPIGDLLIGRLPGRPEEMIHPNLWPWLEYMAYKAIEARDSRARLLAERLSGLDLKKIIPDQISRDDPFCEFLVTIFRQEGQIYSGDDMLEIIRTSICFIVTDESETSGHKNIQYENISPSILELPCNPSDIVDCKPIIVDPIPLACPADLA